MIEAHKLDYLEHGVRAGFYISGAADQSLATIRIVSAHRLAERLLQAGAGLGDRIQALGEAEPGKQRRGCGIVVKGRGWDRRHAVISETSQRQNSTSVWKSEVGDIGHQEVAAIDR